MALTNGKPRESRGNGQLIRLPIATSATILEGSLVTFSTATGRASAAAAGTSRRMAGVAVAFDGPDGTGSGVGNSAGTQYVTCRYLSEVEVSIATAIRTNAALGLTVFIKDDDTVGGTGVGSAGVRVSAGELVAFSTSDKSRGWLAARRFGSANIAI